MRASCVLTEIEVSELPDGQLATALLHAAAGESWCQQGAVELLVSQRHWLRRWELRRAIEAERDESGEVWAWIDWASVEEGPASSGELAVLKLARSLAGQTVDESLADLLPCLDVTNTIRFLDAAAMASRGRIPWAVPSYPLKDEDGAR